MASGNVRKLDMGEVKVRKGKKFPFFELVVIGIGAAIYPDALDTEKGKLSSIKGLIQNLVNHETKPKVTLEMGDEGSLSVDTMLAVISNVPLIGPNMLVTPDASMEDGLFDISLYPDFTKAELLSYSTKVLNQGTTEDGKIQRYRARKLTIKSSPKLDVMADGVMLGKGKVKIKVLPGALRMIAPQVGTGVEKPITEESGSLPPPVSPVPENTNGGQPVRIPE
jgi:diacylglycerol kinase family enzyme